MCFFLPCFGCPFRESKLVEENDILRKENSRLRQLALDHGYSYGWNGRKEPILRKDSKG